MNATASMPETVPAPDLTILDRITEQEVHEWLKARFHQIRAGKLHGLSAMEFNAFDYHICGTGIDVWVGMHASGECVTSKADTSSAIDELYQLIIGEPAKKAADKRSEARRLLEEAASLETIAARVETPA